MPSTPRRPAVKTWTLLAGVVTVVILATTTAWTLSARSLTHAEAAFQAGEFEQASKMLDAWPEALRFGTAQQRRAANLGTNIGMSLNRPDLVNRWFERVPAESPQMTEFVLEAAGRAIGQGRLQAAETLLRLGIARSEPPPGPITRQLAELLWLECRFEEATPLYPWMFDGSSPPITVLQNALANDPRALRPDRVRKALERIGKAAPDDRRVALGMARLELLTGATETAGKTLTTLKDDAPDQADWLALRDYALQTGDGADLARALDQLGVPVDDPLWNARIRQIASVPITGETRARLIAFATTSGTPEALEAAASVAGEPAEAARLRALKRSFDEAFEAYRRRLSTLTTVRDAGRLGELATLAEKAGRPMDAFVLTEIARQPEIKAIPAVAARFGSSPERSPAATAAANSGRNDWRNVWDQLVEESGRNRKSPARGPGSDHASIDPVFEDVTAASDIVFVYDSGRSVIRQLPETMGGGVALIDYDLDGMVDLYAVQGGPFGEMPARSNTGDRLFRNRGDGTFEDSTRRAGLPETNTSYGFGVTSGDFDGDGDADLFVTRWRQVSLLRNRGDGTFEDVTRAFDLHEGWWWPTSAAFADLDADGDLDLYVCQYLEWDERNPRICREGAEGRYVACDPLLFAALPDRVFRNDGDRFVEVRNFAGPDDSPGRGLGVVAADFDGDRRVDLFVANDKSANKLYLNRDGFRFEECALTSGVAANSEGGYQAGMGVDAGDIDGDGLPDLVVTNFFGEGTSAFRNLGGGQFSESGKPWGITAPSRFLLGFGVALEDFDCDGVTDYVSVNGHVNDSPEIAQAMPTQLLTGRRQGPFRKVRAQAAGPLEATTIGRGLAVGDLDRDGRIDLVTTSLDGPLRILRNVTPDEGVDRCLVRLKGRRSNRDGIGARVRFETERGRKIFGFRRGGGSYQSSGEGLVRAAVRNDRIVKVTAEWPSGKTTETSVEPGQKPGTIEIEEP